MKRKKKAPYIFLFTLLCIFILILGVNIGKRVEQTNKEISYRLTHAPTRPSITTTPKPLRFETYTNANCGVQFLYPSSLTLSKETSTSADFQENKTSSLFVTCEKINSLNTVIDNKSVKFEDISLLNKQVPAKLVKGTNGEFYIFRIQNPLTKKSISVSVKKTIYPLFKESFQFIEAEL